MVAAAAKKLGPPEVEKLRIAAQNRSGILLLESDGQGLQEALRFGIGRGYERIKSCSGARCPPSTV